MKAKPFLAESHPHMCNCERESRVGVVWSKTASDMMFAFALHFLSFLSYYLSIKDFLAVPFL